MSRPGRHHRLTAVAVCAQLVHRHRRRIASATIRRVAQELGRAWARGERRRAPPSLRAHLEAAPALRAALPSVHRVVDTLNDGGVIPARLDAQGRSVHALSQRDAVMADMLEHGAILVWETTPAMGMVKAGDGRCYLLRANGRGACTLMRWQDALRVVSDAAPPGIAVPCNVFRE